MQRRAPTRRCSAAGLPVLGICYGQQTMVEQLGGRVEPGPPASSAAPWVEIVDDCALFDGVWAKGSREAVWMSHGDRVTALPPGFRSVAVSEGAPFAVIADDERRFYGVQFHPEVVHTPHGARLLRELHPRRRRLPRRLDDGGLPRPGDRAHPRPGRRAAGSSAGSRAASTPR